MKIAPLLGALALALACRTAPSKPPPPAEPPKPAGPLDKLEAWEDQRSLGSGAVLELAKGPDPAVRARAFLALARIQDPGTTDAVGAGLADPDPGVRVEAAFAAGQLGLSWDPLAAAFRDALVDKLLAQEATETQGPARLAMLEALGKLASPAAVERLTDRLFGDAPELKARAALSLGVAAKLSTKKDGPLLPPRTITALTPLLKKELPTDQRFGAAYALSLAKAPAARALLLVCTQDPLAEVRSLCAKGLAEVGTDSDAVTLKRLLADPDYRVAVEATRALAKLASRCKAAACPAVGALADLNGRAERLLAGDTAGGGQPLLALAQDADLPASARPLLTTLRATLARLPAGAPPQVQNDVAQLDCRLAAAIDRLSGALAEVNTCGGTRVNEVRRLYLGLEELSQNKAKDPKARAEAVAPFLLHAETKVKEAALDALSENGPVADEPAIVERVRGLLGSKDLVLADSAADVAGKLGDQAAIPALRALAAKIPANPDLADAVAGALVALKAKDAAPDLTAWLNTPNAHVRTVAAHALSELTGTPVDPLRVEGPVERLPAAPKNARFKIRTERGDIEVQLFPEDAPRNVGNLYQLARKGYFRKLTFHRIVPDFVAQGGDPRGDGNGGPGYTVRCEVNHQPYLRGAVGIALSGKDTGGSQFFITTSPQPRLEGRYTVVGQVTSGMEVVDSLLEDDAILDVQAL